MSFRFPMPSRRGVGVAALAAALAALAWTPLDSRAQAQASAPAVRHYQIEPGDLTRVLKDFGIASDLLISFDSHLADGRQSAGLRGEYALPDAWRAVLAGTGLEALPSGERSYTLRVAPATVQPGMLGTVTVVGLQERDEKEEVYKTAGSRSVLTRDDIERNRGMSVGDIFRGVPGVLVGELRNSGGLDINIRGMQGQGRVPILVDGARQETTVYRGYSGVVSRSYIDPDLIGGITIDKGPTLSAQGTGATGGLVSMRTIKAEDIVRPGQDFGIRVRGQAIGNNTGSPMAPDTPTGLFTGVGETFNSAPVYRTDCATAGACAGKYALPDEWGNPEGLDRPGTFQPKSYAGSVAIAKRWEKFDLVAAYAQREQGNYYAGEHGPAGWVDVSNRRKLPFYTEVRPEIKGASVFRAGERIPGTNYESKSALLKGTAYLADDQELELAYLRYSSVYSEIMPSQIIRFANLSPVLQPRNSDVTVNTYTSRYHWKPAGQPLLDLRADLWHTRTNATNNSPSETQPSLYNNVREKYKRWGLTLENTSTLQHGDWGESQVRVGMAAQWESVGTTALNDGDSRSAGRSGDRDEYSAFAAWLYKPIETVALDVGLRHTRFKSSDDKDIVVSNPDSPNCVDRDGDGVCDPIPNRNKQSGTAPVLSLSWEPGKRGLQFYGRYAEAYRMPSLFESTSGFSFDAAPDVALKPEHARNREIGINYAKDGILAGRDRLRLKLAYFRNHITDYLTRTSPNLWEEGGSGGELAQSSSFTMRNIDSATFHGLELSGGYDLGVVFTEFGFTKYNKIEICHTGSYRVNRCNDYGIAGSYINNMVPPKWHGSVTLGARLMDYRLVLGVRATLMGQRTNAPQYNNDTARGFLAVVPWHSYRVFDLFASYRVNDRVSIDFNLDNFTDRYYIDALSLGLIPAPGRTARLSVTLRY
ncbi:Fe(3+) dicitrate transport protein FecA precursor [Pigmentiphaga humi]|uniref:Fe(3+) dicitrate transport protein FecA n=2 Tax=Pigmentiphaga humi TaxID=2478468 RepID=A0A3P4AZF6_9BURK|nr:Fe(3+) dicitrate transport protein FecA precursor [Pigmentiphaga humi]